MKDGFTVHKVELIKPKVIDLQLTQQTDNIRIVGGKKEFEDLLREGWRAMYLPETGKRADINAPVWMVYQAAESAAANVDEEVVNYKEKIEIQIATLEHRIAIGLPPEIEIEYQKHLTRCFELHEKFSQEPINPWAKKIPASFNS